ncbi:MAG TPA: hypothetical protein VHE34_09365 [Puia sp.]|uniref:cache domain-containing protein n=1 Tax=Puia sp. TaxID=2045100 RepID=UPI002C894BEF|nr:hypothetical protein [Puia sp.]HVU95422.1 hypothetical protein [Puia sp.]
MRKLGILFLWLVVLFFGFAGFYLFIVPSNKASVNKYGFHILEQLETAIQDKIDADLDTYANNLETLYTAKDSTVPGELRKRLTALGVDSVIVGTTSRAAQAPTSALAAARADSTQQADTTSTRKARSNTRPLVSRRLADIANGRLIYEFRLPRRTIVLTRPISRLMGDLEHAYPAHFYSAFIFLKCEDGTAVTLYKSDGVPIGLKIPTDSLLVGSKGAFYPGITDLHTGGQDFKLFYVPLTEGKLQFSLCGIKDAEAYNQSLRQLPASFVYPFVIILILLAIALPLIKFYIISPTEAIRPRDLAGVAFSLLGGGMLITLTIIQVILLKDANARQQMALSRLSRSIDNNLSRELQKAFWQLQVLDQRAADSGLWKPKGKAYYDVTDQLVKFMGGQDTGYFHFDRIVWVDTVGMQAVTASLDTTQGELHVDVSARPYFTDFINNTAYRLPGNDTSVVSVRAVLTWTDGDFRVVLARRSSCRGMLIVTMSANLYSVNHTVLPSGYGFCIIDPDGRVQLHSEPSRNLVENFLDQSGEPDQLRAAMTGRQALYLENTDLYGGVYGLHLSPIGNMPYYLAVFYDKGYILPVNMRILVFSLIGCGVTLFSCVLVWVIWVVAARRRWTSRPLLFPPLDYLVNLRPDRTKVPIYIRGALLLTLYSVVLVMVAGFNPYNPGINKGVLLLLLVTPPAVALVLGSFWGLWRRWKRREDQKAMNEKEACDEGKGRFSSRRYIKSYALLILTLIVCLGVAPALLYSWHAQNQEILQSVKREQLLTGYQLSDRRPALYAPLSRLRAGLPRDSLYYWSIDRAGIYSVYGDRHYRATEDSTLVAAKPFIFERAYFNLAQRFGNINYDPSYVPVLRNYSADRHWKWMELRADTLPFAFLEGPDLRRAGVGVMGRTAGVAPPMETVIFSALPVRYPYLGFFWKSFLLVLFVGGLLWGLYGLIRRIAREVFLLRWTMGGPGFRAQGEGFSDGNAMDRLPYHEDFEEYLDSGSKEIDLKKMAKGLDLDWPAGWDAGVLDPAAKRDLIQALLAGLNDIRYDEWGRLGHDELDMAERQVVKGARAGREYFKWLFGVRITAREQWLLYNFACYGLLNYKNVLEIDHLLEAGVLTKRDGQVRIFNPAFRAYIVMNWRQEQLPKEVVEKSAWQRFRIPFLILLAVVLAFLFLTQQEAWQRVTALVGALSSALGAVLGLLKNFDNEKAP